MLTNTYNYFDNNYSFESRTKQAYKQWWNPISDFNAIANFFGGGGQAQSPTPAPLDYNPGTGTGGTTGGLMYGVGNVAAPGQVIGATTGPSGGGPGPQQQQQQSGGGGGGPDYSAIDALYNQTMGQLSGIQSNLQGEQSSEIGQVQQGQQRTQKALQQAETDRQAGITTRKGEAQKQETSALEQLRQTFGDLQSQQIAQLSAAGISSSSAAEALGAYLTRDQAQRVGNVIATTGDVMSGLADEEQNVKDWYTQSTTELQQDTQSKIDQINRDFSSRLGQLDQIRGQSAVARQQQRADLFNQYQQTINDLNSYAAQASYALQIWQGQQQQNLASARNALGNLTQQQVLNLQGQGANVSGLQLVGYDANGQPLYSGGKFAFNAANFNPLQNPGSIIQPQQVGGGAVQSNIRSAFQ